VAAEGVSHVVSDFCRAVWISHLRGLPPQDLEILTILTILTYFLIWKVFLLENILSPHDKNIKGYVTLDPNTLQEMGAKDTRAIVIDFEIWRLG